MVLASMVKIASAAKDRIAAIKSPDAQAANRLRALLVIPRESLARLLLK